MTAYPLPTNWNPNHAPTAAELAQLLAAVAAVQQPPMCVLRNTAVQSVNSATFTSVNFDTEEIDTNNGHSTSSNTSRYTCQLAGWYQLDALVAFAANVTGRRLAHYAVNGVQINTADASVMTITSGGGNTGVVLPSRTILLAVNDYVEVQGFQDSGGALNVLASSYLSVRYVYMT